jgi:uncharacterized LabA/DUF88 family protein
LLAAHTHQDEQRLGLFIDFENIAIGVRDAHYRKFDINLVLERLLEKGKVLVKKAYADWSRYSDYKRSFHEAAIELIEVPQKSVGGKNSADIRLVVDAMDMSFQKEHINCFVVASGDSDFSPLVSKLKENNKYVIGLGVKNSTSDLLIENCDEFIFYEDLVRGQQRHIPQVTNVPEKMQEAFALLVDSILALQRENKEVLWGSMVKETMKRKKPSFNETYYGFRTFSHLLEDAQKRGVVVLRRDQKSGSYIVEDLGTASSATTSAPVPTRPEPVAAPARVESAPPRERAERGEAEAEGTNGRPRRRRTRGGRRQRGTTGEPTAAEAAAESAELQDGEEFEGEGEEMHGEGAADDPMHDADGQAAGSTSIEEQAAEVIDSQKAAEEPSKVPGTPDGELVRGDTEPPPDEDRGGFSLFSWMRSPRDRG